MATDDLKRLEQLAKKERLVFTLDAEDGAVLARAILEIKDRLDAFVAEHADDETAINKQFIGSLGLPIEPGSGWVITDRLSIMNSSNGFHLMARTYEAGTNDAYDDGEVSDECEPIRLHRIRTRGQLVRLLGCLGGEEKAE